MLFSGGADHNICVWSTATGQLIGICEGHSHWVLALQTNDNLIFSSSRDGNVHGWDISSCIETVNALPQAERKSSSQRVTVWFEDGTSRSIKVADNASVGTVLDIAKTRASISGACQLFKKTGSSGTSWLFLVAELLIARVEELLDANASIASTNGAELVLKSAGGGGGSSGPSAPRAASVKTTASPTTSTPETQAAVGAMQSELQQLKAENARLANQLKQVKAVFHLILREF